MAQLQRVTTLVDRLGGRIHKLSVKCHRGLKTSPRWFQEAEVRFFIFSKFNRFCHGWKEIKFTD